MADKLRKVVIVLSLSCTTPYGIQQVNKRLPELVSSSSIIVNTLAITVYYGRLTSRPGMECVLRGNRRETTGGAVVYICNLSKPDAYVYIGVTSNQKTQFLFVETKTAVNMVQQIKLGRFNITSI